jgi:hypothetical protein
MNPVYPVLMTVEVEVPKLFKQKENIPVYPCVYKFV